MPPKIYTVLLHSIVKLLSIRHKILPVSLSKAVVYIGLKISSSSMHACIKLLDIRSNMYASISLLSFTTTYAIPELDFFCKILANEVNFVELQTQSSIVYLKMIFIDFIKGKLFLLATCSIESFKTPYPVFKSIHFMSSS